MTLSVAFLEEIMSALLPVLPVVIIYLYLIIGGGVILPWRST